MKNTLLNAVQSRGFRSLLVMLALLLGINTGRTSELPPLNIPVCAKPPLLDGKLDDPAWKDALEIGHLYRPNSDTPAPETTIKLLRDDAWLYIGAHCRNPNMEHAAQLARNHDGAVITDDSLELFLRPTSDNDAFYYHFALSFANIGREQRCNKAGLREVAWNPPWRSATQRQKDGWTAEIAVPLYSLGTEDLSACSINICRNMIEIDLDAYGAKQNETRLSSTLRQNNSGGFHDFANFLTLAGLGEFKPTIPFAPHIATATISGVRQDNDKNFYELKLMLELVTSVAGTVQIKIIEDFGEGETETASQTVELKGQETLTLQVPAGDLRERKVKVVLTDPQDGNLLATLIITDTSALNIIRKAFVGRSYYTSEDTAQIRVELGLPAEMLAHATMAIEIGGRKIAELTGLQSTMTPGVPMEKLAMGDNAVTVRVLSAGRELAAQELNILRLQPRPDCEVQADFIEGVALKNKKPFFPVGVFSTPLLARFGNRGSTENDEAIFRYLAHDIGLNTLAKARDSDIPTFMAMAEKYGFDVINWSYPRVATPMYMMQSRLEPKVDFAKLDLPEHIKQAMQNDKDFWKDMNGSLSLQDRLLFRHAVYKQTEPQAIAEAELMRNYKNLIVYYNQDEPNLLNPDDRIAVAEWYWKTIHAVDPYRPKILVYAKHIPHGDNWTRWADILAYDIYPRPYVGSVFSEPGLSTAYYAWQLRERCRQDTKVMWFVPLANMLDLERSPIGMNKAHILCQAYTAIIYGARGLLYFALGNVVGEDAWNALRTISAQVKEMAPALIAGDIAQNIRYTPDNFSPREQKFPMVNAAVFKYPDGDYLLLAVNILPVAVETEFKIGALRSGAKLFATDGRKSGLFGDQGKLAVANEKFAEKIEPYGVRAWRIKLADHPAPVEVALAMTAIEDERAPAVDVPGIVRQLMLSKNYVPNPCFERQINKNVPDFYRPFFCLSVDPFWGQKGKSDWFLDDATLWNGRASLRMFRRPYLEGGYKTRGISGVFYPPLAKKPTKMTFSFYAKSDAPEASVWVRPGDTSVKGVTISGLSAEWKRHHFAFDLTPGSGANLGGRMFWITPSEGAVIWINGLQIEQGEQPTEFQDDSVPVKKK